MSANHKTYRRASIVRYYSQISRLQPAEAAIRDRLKGQLAEMAMLDVGVGGGRTTAHFAPYVRQYAGIDYSAEMIAACRQRYPKVALSPADARRLPFADDSFDFLLFSFNGIDYMPHGDRLRALGELRRVARPGGYLCFSSHNLQAMARQFTVGAQLRLNPLTTYSNLVMLGLLRWVNRGVTAQQLAAADYLVLRDESHNFSLDTYYIRPQAQLRQLSEFREVSIYPWTCGAPCGLDELAHRDELWLYYVCRVEK